LLNIRFGKILEDLDACAGNIAFKHADDGNPKTRPLTIVTASVDHISLLHKLHADRDMKMEGAISYVGKSSMEVRLKVSFKEPTSQNSYEPYILATFTMVATFDGKASPVNRIVPETEDEKALFLLGERNQRMRKELRALDLALKPPTSEESLIIHNLFLESNESTFEAKRSLGVNMANTHLQTVLLCHPQERNTNNKIFGGYLMRCAYELAWANAQTYCQDRPYFLALDEVNFVKPVSIGDIVILSSQIIHTEGNCVSVKVVAEVTHAKNKTRDITNTFYFIFTCPTSTIPKLIPTTYADAMTFIEGRRRLLKSLSHD